jgi:hypothetical protein
MMVGPGTFGIGIGGSGTFEDGGGPCSAGDETDGRD